MRRCFNPGVLAASLIVLLLAASAAPSGALPRGNPPTDLSPSPYTAPFAPHANIDPSIPAPADLLGFPVGERPASGKEIALICRAIAAASPRVAFVDYGESHEGRPLFYCAIGNVERMAALGEVKASHARLATPGTENGAELKQLLANNPAVVWIGCSVHGDEGSGADAGLALIHHLAADRGMETASILDELIVIIDPLMNPDGRARFIAGLVKWQGRVPDTDRQSILHRRAWPSPRGNHYFLDLNRDWFAMSQPETRGRVGVMLDWHPQVAFDLHEMGAYDSYLFAPPREPYHPELPASTHKWWARFAEGIAGDFGRQGWSCYTGDWNEEFNPNRGAAWPLYTGAIALLAEQASTRGASVMRPDGSLLQYREAVHHQFTAAYALIRESAAGRKGILSDYVDARRAQHDLGANEIESYVIDVSVRPDMAQALARNLADLGVTVGRAESPFSAAGSRNYWGEERSGSKFAAGSYVVDLSSGESRLARAVLDFDPPLGDAFLSEERRLLESGRSGQLYESPAWSLAMAYGAEVYATKRAVKTELSDELAPPISRLSDRSVPSYGYLLDGAAGGAPQAMARLHNAGVQLWGSRKRFEVEGKVFAAGSVLAKLADNAPRLGDALAEIAAATGVRFTQVNHALVDVGEDMGSRHFRLLAAPRVALLAGSPFYQTTFGALWHFIDQDLGLRCTKLRLSSVAGLHLDRYNVIVVPTAGEGQGPAILETLGETGVAALHDWMRRGGTLITIGEAGALLYSGEMPLTAIRQRRDVLPQLSDYIDEGGRLAKLSSLRVDENAMREGDLDAIQFDEAPFADPELMISDAEDEWLRRFAPQGVILRVDLSSEHWLCAGAGNRVPVLGRGNVAWLAMHPANVVGRFAAPEQLRLSGPLWPEARSRWAGSAFLCREGVGSGQAIAFLANPIYRAYFQGTSRLLANALLLGPGIGASVRAGW